MAPLNGAEIAKLSRGEKYSLARSSPKVSSHFLRGLEDRLAMSTKELCAALGISDVVFYRSRKAKECPLYLREAAQQLLEAKGLSLDDTLSFAPKPPRSRTSKNAMVPAGFLEGVEDRLGIDQHRLIELLGVKASTFYQWKKRGRAPVAIRNAISGLMAERKMQLGEIIEARKAAEKPLASHVRIIRLMVPVEQVPIVSALFVAWGFHFEVADI